MSELIERQAALNALMEAVKSVGVLDADDIKTVFDVLPSVQREKAQLSKEGATKDTISRQAAIGCLRDGQICGDYCRKAIEQLPTVQPERTEGEWVLKDYLWECNKCGCRINVKNPLCDNNWNYYFCPHCGTKMTIAVQRF